MASKWCFLGSADELLEAIVLHKAPSTENSTKLLENSTNCINTTASGPRSLAAWGIEGRVPFLDKEFIDVAMHFNLRIK